MKVYLYDHEAGHWTLSKPYVNTGESNLHGYLVYFKTAILLKLLYNIPESYGIEHEHNYNR